MVRSFLSTALGMTLFVAIAGAQHAQVAVHLNDPVLASQYLSVTNKTGLQGNLTYTIEAWVNPIVLTGSPTIVGNDYHSSFWVGLGTAGRVRFYPKGGGGLFFEGATSLAVNRWSHVAVTYSSLSGAAIYVNGVLDGSNATFLGAVGTSAGDLRIGADREAGLPTYFWRGGLDEIRIWDTTHTASRILQDFRLRAGDHLIFTNGYYDDLAAHWDFGPPVSNQLYDIAGNGVNNLATFEGFDYLRVGEPGPPTSDNMALALNGTDDHAILPMADGFAAGLTIDAWVAPVGSGNDRTIAGRDFRTSFWLGLSATGTVRFYPTGGLGQYFESNVSLPPDRWTHIAATYRPGEAAIILNGVTNAASNAFTAPVGENGRDVWIGGDNEQGVAGVPFAFRGYLDNVRISRGKWSEWQVRQRRFHGTEQYPSPLNYSDADDIPRETYGTSFGQRELHEYTVEGVGAHLVRSGAPLSGFGMAIGPTDVSTFRLDNLGGVGSLPDDQSSSSLGVDLFVPGSQTIASAQVFVTAPINDLQHVRVRVRSPLGTWVELLSGGDAVGMDLHTVFSDGSPNMLALSSAPFNDGVRPSQPLSTWNGEGTYGSWRLELQGTLSPTRLGLWAWGLQFNGVSVGAEGPTPRAIALRNSGANPVRGAGNVTFELPRDADVDLSLFDTQGRAVRSLLAGHRTAGSYALNWAAHDLPAGAYFLRLRVDGRDASTLKVSVVR